jgi:hypothetical protein
MYRFLRMPAASASRTTALACKVEGRIDQRQVGKHVGEVADQGAGSDIEMLREQAKVVADGQDTFEYSLGFCASANH